MIKQKYYTLNLTIQVEIDKYSKKQIQDMFTEFAKSKGFPYLELNYQ